MIKVLHTSDWHLGKKLYKKERWPEQERFLSWLVKTISEEKVCILIIAGDIFDTPMPPTYALKGLFNFYKEIESIPTLKKVVVIGGSHDSGKLIEAPIPLLEEKFHILGRPCPYPHDSSEDNSKDKLQEQAAWIENHKITFHESQLSPVKINIALFPFFRSSDILVKDLRQRDDLPPDQMLLESIKNWLRNWNLTKEDNEFNIFVGHHLFGSFFESGSEQGVGLSGLATVPLNIFSDWDLLCLGHIHKPQCLKKEMPQAFYSGSPIPMRFSEKEEKSVLLYEINDEIKVEKKVIPAFRPLIQLESKQETWLEDLKEQINQYDKEQSPLAPFLELTLRFDTPNPSYIDVIRAELANMDIELLNYYQIINQDLTLKKEVSIDAHKIKSSHIDELFELYLQEQNIDKEHQREVKETYLTLMDEISQETKS